jgi:two-component system, OmpR family, sensor histidine kinase MprB
VTFRTRLVLASTAAVVIAVLLAAAAAFFVSRNSLISSLDDALQLRAATAMQHPGFLDGDSAAFGAFGEKAVAVAAGVTQGNDELGLTPAVVSVADGRAPAFFTTVDVGGAQYRELVTPIPPGTNVSGREVLFNGGALQLATPLSGVNRQLTRLGLALAAVAIGGVVLSVLLGWLVARATLGPLNDLTASVEEVAETTDVSRRLDPGGIDELGRLRRAFNRLLSALEVSREAQRQLVLDATHELRTPLTSLRTNLEVVRRLDELPPADREVLVDDVLTQMGELTQLVGDLAELSRDEQRHRDIVRFRLDLLVDDATAVAATHGRHRSIHFEPVLQPCWVGGQPDRIARAVGNLLDNALKWSPAGSVVEVTCAGGEVTVRDHGPGIAPEDLPHVFDRFYRAKAARGLPGSGLGLAIVAQVVEAEGGTVTAGDAMGGGAVFRIRLPVVPAPTASESMIER